MEGYVLKIATRFAAHDDPSARTFGRRVAEALEEAVKAAVADFPLVASETDIVVRCVRHGDRTNRDVLTGKASEAV